MRWRLQVLRPFFALQLHPQDRRKVSHEKIERLDGQMTRVQAQLEQSEHELKEIQQQLSALRGQAGLPGKKCCRRHGHFDGDANLAAAVDELREKQDVQESQAAAQEQAKVGSESRYPVTLSGMILFNGFVNTRAVDVAPTPAMALPQARAQQEQRFVNPFLGSTPVDRTSSAQAATRIFASISTAPN
jgi:DNA-binding FrmR family transcriptional regulator